MSNQGEQNSLCPSKVLEASEYVPESDLVNKPEDEYKIYLKTWEKLKEEFPELKEGWEILVLGQARIKFIFLGENVRGFLTERVWERGWRIAKDRKSDGSPQDLERWHVRFKQLLLEMLREHDAEDAAGGTSIRRENYWDEERFKEHPGGGLFDRPPVYSAYNSTRDTEFTPWEI